jgi:hypothetical protein
MFRGRFAMNDPCPVCGLVFQREEGYFLGAMYVSYVLSAVVLTTFFFTAAYLFPELSGRVLPLVALAAYLPLMPAVFRYSRVVWIYLERAGSPGDTSAGPYEKFRIEQARRRTGGSAEDRDPPA